LGHEGFYNMENLAGADPLELCLRIVFSNRQMWI